ncbi:shikimate kinase [Pontibacillus halophilus JSM 076056 = DSM 19796]|uniref:Shikimate kinase n=1 Tax=Pontibacillus halophilus JSM 076056 = DSM 19796 TaxID=1385510 RepID=A0A0A5GIC2_9BACI|nr:shikimate kinase [Pontibacillus halophilus]KGX90880.1 shikimate kinase [Pontibacillus halophilus JSM 076056 = DSM 19796]
MKPCFLIGFMGSGKSSVGRALSEQLDCAFIDTDEEIERLAGMSIPEIFEREGEAGFRQRETETLRSILHSRAVISTGGGIIERDENVEYMRGQGNVLFLNAQFQTISDRLEEDENRPLWNQELQKRKDLYMRRLPAYQTAAHYVVETDDRSVEAIVSEVMSVLGRV